MGREALPRGHGVCTQLREVGGEVVAQRMTGLTLIEPCRPRRNPYCLLHHRLVQVVEDQPQGWRTAARRGGGTTEPYNF
jgi:hypothetical protein